MLSLAWIGSVVEPAIRQHHSGPFFLLTQDYAARFLRYPGGLLEYASNYLIQWSCFNWLGAALFAITGAGIAAISAKLFQKAGIPLASAFSVIPFTGFILLITCWEQNGLALGLGALLALAAIWFETSLSNIRFRLPSCWFFAGMLFWICGFKPCLLFIILAFLFERFLFSSWKGAFCQLASLLWIPLIRSAFSDIPTIPHESHGSTIILATVLLYSSPILFCLLSRLVWFSHSRSTHLQWIALCGMLMGACLLLYGALDREQQARARMDYYLDHQHYEAVLQAARELRQLDYASESRLHLALFHAGQLGESLFTYTNQSYGQMFAGMTRGMDGCRSQVQPLLELGQLNEAEHMAHEAYEFFGDRPDLLKALAEINVLKDRAPAAKMFLHLLRSMPSHKLWAESALRSLETNALMPFDTNLQQYATNRVRSDLAFNKMPTDLLIRQALHSNPRNAMALEYMMADCLLAGELDKVAEKYTLWAAQPGSSLPRHYEEAILLYEALKKTPVDLKGRTIRSETRERFDAFASVVSHGPPSTLDAQITFTRQFGDTFWYHYYMLSQRKSQPHSAP
jgi:hypothetical protein